MKTPHLFPLLLVTATAFATVFTSHTLRAADVTWTGTVDNDYNNGGNWDSGSPPDFNNRYIISTDGATVTTSGPSVGGSISVAGNGVTAPQLTITQDIGLNVGVISVGSVSAGSGYVGVIHQTSGTVSAQYGPKVALSIAYLASGDSSGNVGSYYFGGSSSATAPVFSATSTRGEVLVGGRPGETGLLAMNGYGTFYAGDVTLGVFNGSAELRVEGGNLNISLSSMNFNQYNGGTATLDAVLTQSGISTINVLGAVNFGSNTIFNLSLDNDFSATLNQQFTIIDTGSGFTGAHTFGNVGEGALLTAGNYQFHASYQNNAFTLTTLAVPEPGAVALMGLGGFVLLFARGRKLSKV